MSSNLAQGTGMFNLIRQLGGSLGIAIMATLLSHLRSIERALLVEHVTIGDPATVARIGSITRGVIARGVDAASAGNVANAIVERQVELQASMLAFSKIYLVSGIALVAALPLLLLFKSGKAGGSGMADAH